MRRTISGLHVAEFEPHCIELQPGRVNWKGVYDSNQPWAKAVRGLREDLIGGGASLSDYLENKVLDHILGKTSFTMPATVALALCTTAPTDASTGATIVEANYTGYARKAVAGSDLNAAASGQTTSANVLTFAACTASTSTIIAWALCDSASTGAGNMLVWGTATSTVISTTQTPATIAAGGLVVNMD